MTSLLLSRRALNCSSRSSTSLQRCRHRAGRRRANSETAVNLHRCLGARCYLIRIWRGIDSTQILAVPLLNTNVVIPNPADPIQVRVVEVAVARLDDDITGGCQCGQDVRVRDSNRQCARMERLTCVQPRRSGGQRLDFPICSFGRGHQQACRAGERFVLQWSPAGVQ